MGFIDVEVSLKFAIQHAPVGYTIRGYAMLGKPFALENVTMPDSPAA